MTKLRLFIKKDSELVSKLLLSVFHEFNLDGVSEEGINFFDENHFPDKIRKDWAIRYAVIEKDKRIMVVQPYAYSLVAIERDSIIGAGRAKYDGWITHCFVSPEHIRNGIGKDLIGRMETWISKKPEINFIRLNASPFGLGFYEHLGYKKTTGIRIYHGLPIYPMKKLIR
jgi:GNAT superfamily N-acetyltransferase